MRLAWTEALGRRSFDTAWASLAVTAIIYAVFLSLLLAKRGGDITTLINAGDAFVQPDTTLPIAIQHHTWGYDGQFYYRLALTPFTNQQTAYGVTLDVPAYRQQRILYPLLARALALGRLGAVPTTLVVVNYLGLCLLGWMGGIYARGLGRHALWGMVFPLYVGFLGTLSYDLTEIVENGLLLSALVCLRRERFLATAFLLSAALLAKEPALLVAVAIGLSDLVGDRPRWSRTTWYVTGLPIAVYLLWQGWLWHHWGGTSLHGGEANFTWPFAGFIHMLIAFTRQWRWYWHLALAYVVILAGIAGRNLRASRANPAEKWAWGLYVAMATLFSGAIWIQALAFLRACSEMTLLGTAIMLGSDSRWRRGILGFGVFCWLILAVSLVR